MVFDYKGRTIVMEEDQEGVWFSIAPPHGDGIPTGPYMSIKDCTSEVQSMIDERGE